MNINDLSELDITFLKRILNDPTVLRYMSDEVKALLELELMLLELGK